MKLTVGLSFLSLCSSVTALDAGFVSLSQLQPGDRFHVAYHSRGCFHDRRYEIDFERGASVTARSSGHAITLTPREVAGLDKLMEFYRSRPPGGCTTEDEITISHSHAGKISREHYLDGSCATYEMKGITQLDDIAKRLGLKRDS
jgi:hypothetical protein